MKKQAIVIKTQHPPNKKYNALEEAAMMTGVMKVITMAKSQLAPVVREVAWNEQNLDVAQSM
jgi:hypothetical protein